MTHLFEIKKLRVMETIDHSKNGVSPKDQRSRGIFTKKLFLFFIVLSVSVGAWGQTASDYEADAKRGDKVAQFNLGNCYFHGLGVAEDDIQAVYWWHKAAEQGHAEAQFYLGNRCYFGEGRIEPDYNTALYWYEKAIKNGLDELVREMVEDTIKDLQEQGYSSSRAKP